MTAVQIIDTTVDIEFLEGENPRPMDQTTILAGVGQMAALISSLDWEDRFKRAFEIMKKIVFFEGTIVVNTHAIDRPCCDEDDAIFYWEAGEFLFNPDPRTRAVTFFHDCWHVVQFRAAGNRFAEENERVAREVDAIERQLEVAKILQCRQEDIDFWKAYENNQQAILARLEQGVDRMIHAKP